MDVIPTPESSPYPTLCIACGAPIAPTDTAERTPGTWKTKHHHCTPTALTVDQAADLLADPFPNLARSRVDEIVEGYLPSHGGLTAGLINQVGMNDLAIFLISGEPEPGSQDEPDTRNFGRVRVTAVRAHRCPITGEPYLPGAQLTNFHNKLVLATPEISDILTTWPQWDPSWVWDAFFLADAVAVHRAGHTPQTLNPVDPDWSHFAWRNDHEKYRNQVRDAPIPRSHSAYGLEIEEWVTLGFETGWDLPAAAVWFVAAGYDLAEARTLLDGAPLTDELREALTFGAALRGWVVNDKGNVRKG